jgi:hypothetical protein
MEDLKMSEAELQLESEFDIKMEEMDEKVVEPEVEVQPKMTIKDIPGVGAATAEKLQ